MSKYFFGTFFLGDVVVCHSCSSLLNATSIFRIYVFPSNSNDSFGGLFAACGMVNSTAASSALFNVYLQAPSESWCILCPLSNQYPSLCFTAAFGGTHGAVGLVSILPKYRYTGGCDQLDLLLQPVRSFMTSTPVMTVTCSGT